MATIVFLLVVAALLGTKALDVHSTWRHVGVAGETPARVVPQGLVTG